MGCVESKKAVSVTPAADSSGALKVFRHPSGRRRDGKKEMAGNEAGTGDPGVERTVSFRLGNLRKHSEGEQVAAGWPEWLSDVAGEAIQGWVPLSTDSFEKLEKIGQGTYSSVFRARNLHTDKIVALKKLRFDNFEPESIRFMAREIQILRRLDHPNIVKLEGLITSKFSYTLYLVFEYMEHDLAGLLSSPDISFTEPQIKCYIQQLLSALEHCHSHGVIHRDIKGANLLVNNEGILKMADFGLANFRRQDHKQPLTCRVVTLWYRPPELLLGATNYDETVDLWSVGCVFAEISVGTPILQGRTEVEQLHKIFKLCGSPSEEYWRTSKLPHATIFKPHRPYSSHLHEAFQSLPASAFGLLEKLLSVEPCKRGTATSALASEYFKTEPYACEPSSLPKYPPNKEIDAKNRDELRRKKAAGSGHGSEMRKSSRQCQPSRNPGEVKTQQEEADANNHVGDNNGAKIDIPRLHGDGRLFVDLHPMPKIRCRDGGRHATRNFQGEVPFSGPLHVTASSRFAWMKKPKSDVRCVRADKRRSTTQHDSGPFESKRHPNVDGVHEKHAAPEVPEHDNLARHMHKRLPRLDHQESFGGASDSFPSPKDAASSKDSFVGFEDDGERVEYSGPLLFQPHKVDELLQQRERHIRRAVRRSWFHRVAGRKEKKDP